MTKVHCSDVGTGPHMNGFQTPGAEAYISEPETSSAVSLPEDNGGRFKRFFRKYFLEGQKLDREQELRLQECRRADLPFHEKYRKYIGFAIPFVFMHTVWWTLAIRYDIFRLYPTRYEMALTMILGATVAGATSEGGGAVAFPVMTLLLHIDSTVARDFSLMIQSCGMTSATFTILWMKVQLEWHSMIASGQKNEPLFRTQRFEISLLRLARQQKKNISSRSATHFSAAALRNLPDARDSLLTDTQTQETFYDTNQSLGQAKFGVVQKVYSEGDGKFYAMKKFNRATRNAAQRAMSEAAILEEAQRVKGVVGYKTLFADTFYLNLVVEYMENGSLTDYMSRKQLTYLGEDAAAYFAYQTALVLIGLRKEKIIHRDVTPGNIFIGARGECKLGDFEYGIKSSENLFDPVGTIEYAAPEIFDRESYPRGYNYKVDWWMLGITIYEIAFGMQLFADEEEILSKQITFPANASQHLIALLLGLLNRDPRTRLSEQEVTGHDWFKNKNVRNPPVL
ncbi:protein kinase domain-containing protein [Ditylenchus destructor]|nr:protein kinase domain-containing protein [Ditylenchus destructor]